MNGVTSRALVCDPEMRRALQLDALASILPMERRDRLAELLAGEDAAALKHLAQEGMGENTLRALASDLAHLESWALAAAGRPPPWPAPESLALKFVAHLANVAVRSNLATPRPATPTARGGCFWSGGRSRPCANGCSARTSAGGPVFHAIDRWVIEERALTPQSILDGVAPLRDGGARGEGVFGARVGGPDIRPRQPDRGLRLPEAMQQSQHRSVQQAASYYNEAERAQGMAVRLLVDTESQDMQWMTTVALPMLTAANIPQRFVKLLTAVNEPSVRYRPAHAGGRPL